MKNFYRKIAVVVCVLLPVALFFVTREKLSWRPVKVATFTKSDVVAISPDERFIAIASVGNYSIVSILALENGQVLKSFQSGYEISNLIFSADSRRLAWAWDTTLVNGSESGTRKMGVALWDISNEPREFEIFEAENDLILDKPTHLRFSPDEKVLWLSSTDNLRAWNIVNGKLVWRWRKHELERVSSLADNSATSQNCSLHFRFDYDGYSVWNVKTKKRLLCTPLPDFGDGELHFSGDASLATYYSDLKSSYPVIEARTARVLWRSGSTAPLTLVGDNAIRHMTNRLEVLNARNGKPLRTLPAVPKTDVLRFVSRDWLYSIDHKYETLYRQRLQ